MATAWVTASLLRPSRRFPLCFAFLLLCCFHHASCYTPELLRVTCRETLDLRGMNLKSGIIISNLPDRIPIYPNPDQYCDIFISFSEGSEMMFYFESLDLYSGSGGSRCDSTNIELFDGSTNVRVRGLEGPVCGRLEEMPTNVYYVLNRLLVIRANSKGDVQGSGFSIHFTVYRKGFPCNNRDEFSCEDYDAHSGGAQQGFKRCVDSQLVCDDYNDCGDWADERQNCNDLTAGAIAAIVLVAVGFVALVVGLIVFCKIRRQREIRSLNEKGDAAAMRDTSYNSRGGMMSPFSASSDTMDKDKYIPRYSTGRNSTRARNGNGNGGPGYEEHPPPYTEKAPPDAGSEHGTDYDDQPRTRSGSRRRDRSRDRGDRGGEPDDVFREEDEDSDAFRARRGRSRSQDKDPRDDRYPPRDDRKSLDRDDRRSARDRDDDRYPPPPRRDDQDSPPSRRGDRDRDRERPRSRYDDDRDRDRPRNRYDDERDRDRDRPKSRHDDDRDRDRTRPDDRDRERGPGVKLRDRPTSRPTAPVDEDGDPLDQLHPLRVVKRLSTHTDTDHDTSREEDRPPRHDPRDRRDDRRDPKGDPRDGRDDLRDRRDDPRDRRDDPRDRRDDPRDRRDDPRDRRDDPRDRRERDDPRDRRERDDRAPPRDKPRSSSRGDDRPPRNYNDRPADRERERSSRQPQGVGNDSYEDMDFPAPPPPIVAPEEDLDDVPPAGRSQRRRSRSREDRERGGRGGGGRGGDRRPPPSIHVGGFGEQSV